MKMFKKLLAAALAGVLALSVLTACSSGSGSSTVGASGKAVMQAMKSSPQFKKGPNNGDKINPTDDNSAQATRAQDNLLTGYINGSAIVNSFKTRFGSRTDSSQSVIDYFKWEFQNGTRPNNASSIFNSLKGADSSLELMQAAIIKVEKEDTGNAGKQADALWKDLSTVYYNDNYSTQWANYSPDPSKNIYLSVSNLFEVDGSYYRIAFLTGRLYANG